MSREQMSLVLLARSRSRIRNCFLALMSKKCDGNEENAGSREKGVDFLNKRP